MCEIAAMTNLHNNCCYLLLYLYFFNGIFVLSVDLSLKDDCTDKFKFQTTRFSVVLTQISSSDEYFQMTTLPHDLWERFKQLNRLPHDCVHKYKICDMLVIQSYPQSPTINTLEYLDLSHNTIRSIPDKMLCGFLNLKVLKMSFNEIREIGIFGFGGNCGYNSSWQSMCSFIIDNNKIQKLRRNEFRKLVNLRFLYLATNNMQEIESGAFNGLYNVTLIDLRNNRLRTLPKTLFKNLIYLTIIQLQFNELIALPKFLDSPNLIMLEIHNNRLTYLPNLTSIRQLRILNLQNNKISNITRFSKRMPANLTQINLSGNNITVIGKEVFGKHKKIYKLMLSHNNIYYIEPEAFKENTRLRKIYVNNNHIQTLDNLLETIPFDLLDASYSNITFFSHSAEAITFRLLNLSHNQIEGFNFSSRTKITNSSKISIDMSFNNLSKNINLPIPSIVNHIWLNDNNIEFINLEGLELAHPKIEIFLHNNAIGTFCNNVDKRYTVFVTLRGNPLVCSCETEWIKVGKSKEIIVTDKEQLMCTNYYPSINKFNYLTNSDHFLCSTKCSKCFKFLNDSYKSKCEFQCLNSCQCFSTRRSTFQYVDCSRRKLTYVPYEYLLDSDKMYADKIDLFLDGNNLSYLTQSSFKSMNNINVLFLNNNHIENFNSKVFENLKSLTLLNLESNLLKVIPKNAFANLKNLQKLYLSHNKLLQLDFLPADLGMLEILELHNNYISGYPVQNFENMTKLQSITLQMNFWSCECDYIESFNKWLRQTNKVKDKNINCKDEWNNRALIYDQFLKCNSNPLTWISVVVSVTIVVIFLSSLVFVYRLEVQVILYSRYGVRIFRRNDADLDQDKYFDIFMSYSSMDTDFLVANILPNLETIDHPYSICLHERDFLAGVFISENIVSAIDKCRRTIILLTEDFVQSEWCKYEFKMAHAKMLEDKCNRMVVIVKDKVPENVDPLLRAYLRTNTYLTWGERLFWKKLYFALPDPLLSSNQETAESSL